VASCTNAMATSRHPGSEQNWEAIRAVSRQSLPDALEGEGLPDLLLHFQANGIAVIDQNKVTVIEKSRRIGFTWSLAAHSVLAAATRRSEGGMDVLYIGYSKDMAREYIDTCAMWAKAFSYAASDVQECVFTDLDEHGQDRDIQAFRIILASGFEIMALTSSPRSLRGKQGLVIIDEAAFHDDLPAVMKSALAMLMWGGKVVVVSTHDGEDNPFNVICEDIRKGRKPYKLLKITFDDAMADGLYKRICLVTKKTWSPEAEAEFRKEVFDFYGEYADEELMAIPSQGSGTALPPALVQRQMLSGVPVVRIERGDDFKLMAEHLREAEIRDFCERELKPLLAKVDPDLPTYYGQDFARKGHLSVCWPAQRGQDMKLRPLFTLEMRNIPYEAQKQIVHYILDRLPNFMRAAFDATGNGGFLAEVSTQRYGAERVVEVAMTTKFYEMATPKWIAAFEDGTTFVPDDLDVYNDHRAVKRDKGVSIIVREDRITVKGEDGKTVSKKRHGDSAVAHLLCHHAAQEEVMSYGYTPAAASARDGRDHPHDFDDDNPSNWERGAW